jgi:hypothetical protein
MCIRMCTCVHILTHTHILRHIREAPTSDPALPIFFFHAALEALPIFFFHAALEAPTGDLALHVFSFFIYRCIER